MNFYSFAFFTHKTKWQIYLISSPFSQGQELSYRPIISKIVRCPLVYSSVQKAQNHGLWCCIYLYAHTPKGEGKNVLTYQCCSAFTPKKFFRKSGPGFERAYRRIEGFGENIVGIGGFRYPIHPFLEQLCIGFNYSKRFWRLTIFFRWNKKLWRRSSCTLFHLIVNIGIMRTVKIYCTAIGFKAHVLTSENISQILKSTRQNEN